MLIPLCFINTANGARWSFIGSHPLPYAQCILNLGGSRLDSCLFLKELMQASESSSIHLPYGDKKFWLNTAKCAVIYHSGGGIVSRKNNPPSGSKEEVERGEAKK